MVKTPQSFKYQAVASDARGVVIADQAASIQISILQGSKKDITNYNLTRISKKYHNNCRIMPNG